MFGIGPRECVGKNMAKDIIYVLFSKLISEFKFEAVKPLDLTPVYGLTYTPKPQLLKVTAL